MIAALGSACLPTRSRSAARRAVKSRYQFPFRRQHAIRGKKRSARAESSREDSARGNRFAEHKRLHCRLFAVNEFVVCRVRVRQGDTVADAPTQRQKGRLDRWYSYITVYQILSFAAFPNTLSRGSGA
jgi:hypothetical protein